jgi:hypothetical protein
MLPFRLHAKDKNHVCPFKCFFNSDAPNRTPGADLSNSAEPIAGPHSVNLRNFPSR